LTEPNIATVRLDPEVLSELDRRVQAGEFKTRSDGIKSAINFYLKFKSEEERGYVHLTVPVGLGEWAEEMLVDHGRYSSLQSLLESALNMGLKAMELELSEVEELRRKRSENQLNRKLMREGLKED